MFIWDGCDQLNYRTIGILCRHEARASRDAWIRTYSEHNWSYEWSELSRICLWCSPYNLDGRQVRPSKIHSTGCCRVDHRRNSVHCLGRRCHVSCCSIHCRVWHRDVDYGKQAANFIPWCCAMHLCCEQAIPMYQAEVSTPESRGFMVSMHGIMFAMGYSLSAWIGFGCFFMTLSGSSSSFAWRFPLAFQMFPAILLLISSIWLPFSPRWLLQQNRPQEAHDVIRRLHHTPGDVHEELATKEFLQMKKQLELDRQIKANAGTFDLFKTPANRKRAWVGFSLMFGNQFTGSYLFTRCPNTRYN